MNSFDRLHPALQHHIVNSLGWKSLRPVQSQSIDAILRGANLIILAPTAGGKTEAAFFPIMSQILEHDWEGLTVLYVSPIKALLNNQQERLEHYFELVGRRAAVWHGDVATSAKKRLVSDPPDCLLTTPESLEGMLTSGSVPHDFLFEHLQCVVVDEVHSFAGDDRGWHLLSVLERITRIAKTDLQRIGLSATVGNPIELLGWLSASSNRPRQVIEPESSAKATAQVQVDYVGDLQNAAAVISKLHKGEKRLVFCDSRARVEELGAELRDLGVEAFVTHSSLGLDERTQTERAFAEGTDCVIVATSALELGIDVGDLDRVIQIDAPSNGGFISTEDGSHGKATRILLELPLSRHQSDEALLKATGLVELWSQGFVEPIHFPQQPKHILSQQVMALALQERGIGRGEWFDFVRSVPAFADLEIGDADDLVAWMLARKILWEEEGILWFGTRGEATYGRKNFLELLSVFSSPPLFVVRHGKQELGSVHQSTFLTNQKGPVILTLGGRSWQVNHLDWKRKIAYVEPTKDRGRSKWYGEGQTLDYVLCQTIMGVLASDETSERWTSRAREQMSLMRDEWPRLTGKTTLLTNNASGDAVWWTFAGGKANASLAHTMNRQCATDASWDNFSVRLKSPVVLKAVEETIDALRQLEINDIFPEVNEEGLEGLKFSDCLRLESAKSIVAVRLSDPQAVEEILNRPIRSVITE